MLGNDTIYTVSHLNQAAHTLLNTQLGWIRVQGEISNFKKASSGHCYFSLKDDTCQVNCVLFVSHANSLTALLENGKQVIATANVGLYQPRGDYQLNVRQLEDAGEGLLQMAFEQLKKKLAEQGLFDTQFKVPLPATPHVVGVVTSPHGAAIRDILATLKRRFLAANVIIYPTEVQGKTAAAKIAKAIQVANLRKECDVLIVARGGGSAEDLWAFNEEVVAWAIFNSEIPIVTGIGHQVDTTIADYVADYVASTPTAAAEAVAPHQKDWLGQARHFLERTHRSMRYVLDEHKHLFKILRQQLHDYQYKLQEKTQTLDRLENILQQCFHQSLFKQRTQLNQLTFRLNKKNPFTLIQQSRTQFTSITQQLHQTFKQKMHERHQRFSECITTLRVVSPLATLERGYALAMTPNNDIIRTSKDVKVNDVILLKLAKVELLCQIQQLTEK